jgi:hypothetical protein
MSTSLRVRCGSCAQQFAATAASPCANCGASAWQPCVVETDITGIDPMFVHPSGIAFFLYNEAARDNKPVPEWAAAAIPASSDTVRAQQLRDRLAQAIASNSTYLAIASPSNAQNTAQLKALTRQVQAILRLQQGSLGAVD